MSYFDKAVVFFLGSGLSLFLGLSLLIYNRPGFFYEFNRAAAPLYIGFAVSAFGLGLVFTALGMVDRLKEEGDEIVEEEDTTTSVE